MNPTSNDMYRWSEKFTGLSAGDKLMNKHKYMALAKDLEWQGFKEESDILLSIATDEDRHGRWLAEMGTKLRERADRKRVSENIARGKRRR